MPILLSSFLRKQESSHFKGLWIPALRFAAAGMTVCARRGHFPAACSKSLSRRRLILSAKTRAGFGGRGGVSSSRLLPRFPWHLLSWPKIARVRSPHSPQLLPRPKSRLPVLDDFRARQIGRDGRSPDIAALTKKRRKQPLPRFLIGPSSSFPPVPSWRGTRPSYFPARNALVRIASTSRRRTVGSGQGSLARSDREMEHLSATSDLLTSRPAPD
jgi:hypothetical protein